MAGRKAGVDEHHRRLPAGADEVGDQRKQRAEAAVGDHDGFLPVIGHCGGGLHGQGPWFPLTSHRSEVRYHDLVSGTVQRSTYPTPRRRADDRAVEQGEVHDEMS